MGLRSKILTEQEKTAIIALVYGFIPNWREAYRIADGETEAEAAQNIHFADYVSKWKTSAKVESYLQTVRNQKAVQENDLIKAWEKQNGNSVRKETKNETAAVDYSDPANRKKLYNEVIAAAADDPKTQLDAAKMFEQIQRDDRAAAAENKQVRAYLPITCDACPLYQARRKKSV